MKVKRLAMVALTTALMLPSVICTNAGVNKENKEAELLNSWYYDYKTNDLESDFDDVQEYGYHNQATYYSGSICYVCTYRKGTKVKNEYISMGYRVKKKKAKRKYSYGFVTCGHGCDKSIDKYIYADMKCKRKIGKIEKCFNKENVDASYVRLLSGKFKDQTPLQDKITPKVQDVKRDDKVCMYGAVSGKRTKKNVKEVNHVIYDDFGNPFEVIEVELMSRRGDSGAVVYTKVKGENRIVGIVKGETTVTDDDIWMGVDRSTYVIPAKRINDKLGVKCY